MSLFIKKPLAQLLAQAGDSDKGLKRTLGAGNLVALGIGAIIGAGLFVRTAAAAGEAAGPAVVISFIIAAVGCAFAGLCYAEFASMIPIAGSAYTYAYATMGELVAWIIGWALVLEYALGAATVSIAWSEYLNNLLGGVIPYSLSHSPFEYAVNRMIGGELKLISTTEVLASDAIVHQGIMNLPALIILLVLTLVLIKGTSESAGLNAIIVFIKVVIVLVFIFLGWSYIKPENYVPYTIPAGTPGHDTWREFGWGGVLGGAGIVFFAFIGFDAVSTAAQEAKNPKRDMPIGILGSLVVCTILYVLFSHVLTGISNWQEFKTVGKEASVAYAIKTYMQGYEWLEVGISIAILAGFSSVILAMLFGQSRVFYSMANDGLIPKVFSDLHPKFRTPYKSNLILFVFVGVFSGFVPGSMAGDLTSIGTLFAFVLVCVGVWVMRVKNPELKRAFKTPLVPLVPILGIIVCSLMIAGLDPYTIMVAVIWMAIGLVVYFTYSRFHSYLRKNS
ncbi:amino acid permease [Chryseosolibacter indicus]|uniref:Amino acid permease n=1 Tax=Chryseosolibacter indicus TaxID=2782351 RepID=A0ABS5VT27_9BACT|nr:amino acid permease [Chryseosolibacter indicus]MBT1704590.1 amino acid permease [Chryseosolibacter indicus]